MNLSIDQQIDAAHSEAERIEADARQIEARIVKAGGAEAQKLLRELTAWVIDETDFASKAVIEAVKGCAFVPTEMGEYMSVKDLLDPQLPVSKAFHQLLRSCLPERKFDLDHSKLLRRLGMRKYA